VHYNRTKSQKWCNKKCCCKLSTRTKKKKGGELAKKKRDLLKIAAKTKTAQKRMQKDLNPAEIQKFLFHEDQTPSRGLKNETKIVLNHKNSCDS